MSTLTDRQKELARHALGLGNTASGRSYRNRSIIPRESPDWEHWDDLVTRGLAVAEFKVKQYGGNDFFSLTPEGARLALQEGESLDPEDFPGEPSASGGAKHTPEPWELKQESADPEWHILTHKNRIVANVHIEAGNAVDAANAALLRGAPGLLDGCRLALDILTGSHESQEVYSDEIKTLRGHIAKAETFS